MESISDLVTGMGLALKNADRHVNNAMRFHRECQYCDAVVSGTSAREEVGRFLVLTEMAGYVVLGQPVPKELHEKLKSHPLKLCAAGSLTPGRLPRKLEEELAELLEQNGGERFAELLNERLSDQSLLSNKLATEDHRDRMAAQYVDRDSGSGGWMDPIETSYVDSLNTLVLALKEVSIACGRFDWHHQNGDIPHGVPVDWAVVENYRAIFEAQPSVLRFKVLEVIWRNERGLD